MPKARYATAFLNYQDWKIYTDPSFEALETIVYNEIVKRKEKTIMATTADEVWRLLGELIEVQKETERKLKNTEQTLKEFIQKTEKRFQNTDALLAQFTRKIKEPKHHIRDFIIDTLSDFTKLELRPCIFKLFANRGIILNQLWSEICREEDNNEYIYIELLAVGSSEAVAIEVKSKLTKSDVDEHLETLGKFKRLLPRYQNIQLLGAVAAMVAESEVARYAYHQGLFVITQSGDDLIIVNDSKFQPKIW